VKRQEALGTRLGST